jgi:hypothetical protein
VPEEPADEAEACGPEEARIYIGPTEPPRAHHKTLELARVKVRASALPAGSEERSRETVLSPRPKRRRWAAALGVGAAVISVGALSALRGKGGEHAAASATAIGGSAASVSATVCAAACAASAEGSASASAAVTASAVVTVTASVVVTASAAARAAPRVRATADVSDPYSDAATPAATSTASASVPPRNQQPAAVFPGGENSEF